MLNNEEYLIPAFRKLHKLSDSSDVRLMQEDFGAVGVCLYKHGEFYWGQTLVELVADLVLELAKKKDDESLEKAERFER